MAVVSAHLGSSHLFAKSASKAPLNLVPTAAGRAPNYWCIWAVQNYMYGHGAKQVDPEILEGDSASQLAHNALNEQAVLGDAGWAKKFFPRVRGDLYLMLDDGWEAGGTASFELDAEKFSSLHGTSTERLSGLNAAVREEKWRSLALWCRNTPGGVPDEKLEALSEAAKIPYWKIDMGDPDFHLIQVRREHEYRLLLEHVYGEDPVNGDWKLDGRFGTQPNGSRRQEILAHTDVYRTYDVTSILSLPTTLDHLAEMLHGAQGRPDVQALLNVEDEVYVAAAMGCTMGVLRHPLSGLRPAPDLDLFFNGARQAKRRIDEVERALRWQRIAPPFTAGEESFQRSEEILIDSWTFKRGETWATKLVDQTVHQGAPAAISRNMPLPRVISAGEKPFVFAARFPNGAVAVGMQERTRIDRAWYMPQCRVEVEVGSASGPIGVFGCVEKLALRFNTSLAGKRLFAQDLLSDEAVDITSRVPIDGRNLNLYESDLRSFGLKAATKGDLSSPGLVLVWR